MTIREWAEDYCTSSGMWPKQAKAVVDMVESEIGDAMENRWHDQIEGYDKPLLVLLRDDINSAALRWIDANLPKAWYRPAFGWKNEDLALKSPGSPNPPATS